MTVVVLGIKPNRSRPGPNNPGIRPSRNGSDGDTARKQEMLRLQAGGRDPGNDRARVCSVFSNCNGRCVFFSLRMLTLDQRALVHRKRTYASPLSWRRGSNAIRFACAVVITDTCVVIRANWPCLNTTKRRGLSLLHSIVETAQYVRWAGIPLALKGRNKNDSKSPVSCRKRQ